MTSEYVVHNKTSGLSDDMFASRENTLALIRRALIPESQHFGINEGGEIKQLKVTRTSVGPLITRFGKFWQIEFTVDDQWEIYQVLFRGELDTETLLPVFDQSRPLVFRPDSGCATGQKFPDLTCDCKDQLFTALATIEQNGQGLVIHMPTQDGRGNGIDFKLGTMWLQAALGIDTVEAAQLLAEGREIDSRTYAGVVAILNFLGVNHGKPGFSDLILLTNNPLKGLVLPANGFTHVTNEAISVNPTEYTAQHLEAKKVRLGHVGLNTKW